MDRGIPERIVIRDSEGNFVRHVPVPDPEETNEDEEEADMNAEEDDDEPWDEVWEFNHIIGIILAHRQFSNL